jgi:hypothetical protein
MKSMLIATAIAVLVALLGLIGSFNAPTSDQPADKATTPAVAAMVPAVPPSLVAPAPSARSLRYDDSFWDRGWLTSQERQVCDMLLNKMTAGDATNNPTLADATAGCINVSIFIRGCENGERPQHACEIAHRQGLKGIVKEMDREESQ